MRTFEDIDGSLGMLLVFLILSWSLAAVGEQTAYRGFIQTGAIEVFGDRRLGLVAAVGVSAVLFGLAHTEQRVVGVVATMLDAVFFSGLRLHCGTPRASIPPHGFNTTIGLTAFYFAGLLYGLW